MQKTLEAFQLKQNRCLNCNRSLLYEFEKEIEEANLNSDNSTHTVEVSAAFKKEYIALQSNSIATRNQISLSLHYQITHQSTLAILSKDNILTIETRPILHDTLRNFAEEEEMSVKLLQDAMHELKLRLFFYSMQHLSQNEYE